MSREPSTETRYRILKFVAEHPYTSQRELADELRFSLGKANYCLRALIEKGLVKARNFRSAENKRAYGYILTPRGFEEKIRVAFDFLRRKVDEYERLAREIEKLTDEVRELSANSRRI